MLPVLTVLGSILGSAFGAWLALWLYLPEMPDLAPITAELRQLRVEVTLYYQLQMARHDGVEATVRHASQVRTHGPHGPVK